MVCTTRDGVTQTAVVLSSNSFKDVNFTMPDTMRTRVKICGLTRIQDVHAAVRAGADAVGLVFYPGSKRAVTIDQARELRQHVPAFVSVVALFVNAEPDYVHQVIQHVQPDLLQFHGDESPDACAAYGHRYMRAFRIGGPQMDSADLVLQAALQYPDAAAWLFDTYSAGYGGSGVAFDHGLLAAVSASPVARPIVLAGGLDATSVADAVIPLRPYAVDVSSGVESSAGIKSESRIRAFVQAVRDGDAT